MADCEVFLHNRLDITQKKKTLLEVKGSKARRFSDVMAVS